MNIEDLNQKFKDKIDAFKKEMQQDFAKHCSFLFEKYPRLKSFGFTAYTPYFNDGDECTYSVNVDYPTINGYSEYGETDNGAEDLLSLSKNEIYCTKTGQYITQTPDYNAREIIDAVKELISADCFDEFFWKSLIGDHCTVTITAEGMTIEDYDHE